MSSLCASGTLLNVRTPQPRRESRYAPKVTRHHNGSCTRPGVSVSLRSKESEEDRRAEDLGEKTYHGDNLFLDHRREGEQLEEESEVELDSVSFWFRRRWQWPYRGRKEPDRDGLLGTRHVCGGTGFEGRSGSANAVLRRKSRN